MEFFKKLFGGQNQTQQVQRARVIDVDALLKDIEAEAPSGPQDLEYDPAFIALEKLAEGTPEKRVGDKVIEEGREPPWREVKASALGLLERTHDIRVTITLLRALLQTDGLPGFGDGVVLLAGMVEKYWDSLYPQLDPEDNNDPTMRVNILMNLCDRQMMVFPLFTAPLCSSRALGRFSLRDIHIATGKIKIPEAEKAKAASTATIQAAFQDCGADQLQPVASAVTESLERLTRMEAFLTERIGAADAPHLVDIRQVLKDMEAVLGKQEVTAGTASEKGRQPPSAEAAEVPAAGKKQASRPTPASTGKPMEEITSRQDVITLLDSICSYYEQYEPASPVPILLKRAKGLVEMDFLTLMKELAPDAVSQLKVLGGIKDG